MTCATPAPRLWERRSDILGFNAPIEVEGGYYYYSDPDYSIFNTFITGMDLMTEVFHLLVREKDKLNGYDFLWVMERLAGMTGMELPEDLQNRILKTGRGPKDLLMMSEATEVRKLESISEEQFAEKIETYNKKTFQKITMKKDPGFQWGRILELLQ